MSEHEARKGGGGKLSRSETVTVRLDPKLRYLAELAARLHRRTLSSYIEWAIAESLASSVIKSDPSNSSAGASIEVEAENLWDVDEADRFAKLALRYPHLLTHEEQVRWKLIRENGFFWRGSYSGGQRNEWAWAVDESSLHFERLRRNWAELCRVADSGTGYDKLPTWPKTLPTSAVPLASMSALAAMQAGRTDESPL